MRIVVQRATHASVTIGKVMVSSINGGLLVFLGIEESDKVEDIEWLCQKLINIRIFNDEHGIMNIALKDIRGEFLVVSQFTLHASTKKGNRPSYIKAAKHETAIPLYNLFLKMLAEKSQLPVKSGQFGVDMKVALVNDGPVTILIDSKNRE